MSGRILQGALSLYLLIVVSLSGCVLLQLFADPVPCPAASAPVPPEKAPVCYAVGWSSETVNQDVRLLLISGAMGALGAAIHVLTSLAVYAGNRRFRPSWTLWYLLRPWIGVVLAVVLYFALRGGLLTAADGSALNPYGIAALCGMTGMFSKQAADKLEELFSMLFRTADGAEAKRADKLLPTPTIAEVVPPILERGKAGQVLEILGQGFDEGSVALVAGRAIQPDQREPGKLRATLAAELVATAGELEVAVRSGSGATSAAFHVTVAD